MTETFADHAARPRRRIVIVLVTGVISCALALGVALWSGRFAHSPATDAAVAPMLERLGTAPAPAGVPNAGDLAPLLERLATRLKSNPDDPEGWSLLARGYVETGRHADAVPAFRMAVDKGQPDAQLLADFADALGVAQGRKLAGEPAALAQRALALDARHPKALALAASAAFEQGDYAQAIRHWEVLQSGLPPDSPDAASIAANIAEARALADGATPQGTSLSAAIAAKLARASAADVPDTPAAPASAHATALAGTVSIAPSLAGRVRPDDTLLVYARPRSGSPAPLAIVRARAADLPYRFTLDEHAAMAPGRSLAGADDVVVVARVTRTGNAVRQPGDLEGRIDARVGARDVALAIAEVVP